MTPAEMDNLVNDINDFADDIAAPSYPYMKFTKGNYTAGADKVAIQPGVVAVLDMWNLVIGYQKWVGGNFVTDVMGLPSQRFRMPARPSLGDNDQSLWELDDYDKPSDPWAETYKCLFWFADKHSPLDIDCMIFSTSSAGGLREMKRIYGKWAQQIKLSPKSLPVCKLGATTFQVTLKTGREITVDAPVFELVGWSDAERWQDGNQATAIENSPTPSNAPPPVGPQEPQISGQAAPMDPLDHTDPMAAMGVSLPQGRFK